ncbi:hypothetical protein [Flagellimonas hadalis]|uniref:Uncharacterized protein n=1 Tax=Flagellimonas hadalis TaxID=2597517 RepID=A0A5N5IXC8_9FLAO|nr:hypothetical protein [Allomuricauda hadalis]KAB5489420.1 hypothetical protein FOT42_008220 [Allomuricauda hadalis]
MSPISIPNLPTDNLYKFEAISGVFIFLFAVVFLSLQGVEYLDDINDLEKKESIEILQMRHLLQDQEWLSKEIDLLKSQVKELDSFMKYDGLDGDNDFINLNAHEKLHKRLDLSKDPNYRDYMEFRYKYREDIFPNLKTFKELAELTKENEKTLRKLSISNIDLNFYELKINQRGKILKLLILVCCILMILGTILAIRGFRHWYIKVQSKIDLKMDYEVKSLKSQIKKLEETMKIKGYNSDKINDDEVKSS